MIKVIATAFLFLFSAAAVSSELEIKILRIAQEVEENFSSPELRKHQVKVSDIASKASVQDATIHLNAEFTRRLSNQALAFVIAHEVAHTSLFHSDKMAWAAIFRHGLFKFFSGNTQGLLTSLSTDPKLLELSRRQELEADAKASKVLIKMGINPCQAFKEVILLVDNGVVSDEFVSTHGSNRTRLEAVCSMG